MAQTPTRPLSDPWISLNTIKIVDYDSELDGDILAVTNPQMVAQEALIDPVGRVLSGRYLVQSLLGSGGMGAVFKALDLCRADLPEHKRCVAVKILHQNLAGRPTLLASLRREFYCAQALAHPNIVQVYETDSDRELAFFTMELLTGDLLSTVMNRTRPDPLPREYAWAVIRDIGAGLVHAHARQVVHGDLKPQNVMITADNEVRILDFGSSGVQTRRRIDGDLLERDPVPAATPRYTCCELLDGQQSDPRDDLFAFACITYELLTGEHPFQGCNASQARAQGLSPQWPSGLTLRQWRTLQQGLAWQREDRSLAVREFLIGLGVPLTPSGLAPVHLGPSPGTRARSRRRLPTGFKPLQRRRVLLGAALTAALGLALVEGIASWNAEAIAAGGAASSLGSSVAMPRPIIPGVAGDESQVGFGPRVSTATVRAPSPALAAMAPRQRPAHRDVTISAGPLTIAPDARFAEITITRSAAVGTTSFTWWTEESTAQANRDYVPQLPATHTFSKGRRTMKLYVRLLHNPARQNKELLYVVAVKGNGAVQTRGMVRAAVWIPAQARPVVASN